MKTAQERAREALEVAGFPAVDLLPDTDNRIRSVVSVLKQYARDQRHLCAERVLSEFSECSEAMRDPDSFAHAVIMNTPFPGEGA